MSAPIFTYEVIVSGEEPGVAGSDNIFWFKGEGDSHYHKGTSDLLECYSYCGSTPHGVYKFDTSHSSCASHNLSFSHYTDGTWNGGVKLLTGQGFYECGIPGEAGASVKIVGKTFADYWDFTSDPSANIYPFCSNHALMGGGTSFVMADTASSDECEDNDYSCEPCGLESAMSGVFNTLSGQVKTELDNTYDPYQVTGYSIETGVEYGSYPMCEMVGVGLSQAESEAMLTGELAPLFHNSGFCVDRRTHITGYMNVNNISLSYNYPYSHQSDGLWRTHATGFSDRRHRVIYAPQVSGQRTSVSVDVNCPETQLQVNLERDVQLWDTTGTATKPDLSESGYKTTLTADCVKIRGGTVSLCEKTFVYDGQNITGCWEEYCDKGNYGIVYKTGSFENSSDKHIIGTGVLSAEKLI